VKGVQQSLPLTKEENDGRRKRTCPFLASNFPVRVFSFSALFYFSFFFPQTPDMEQVRHCWTAFRQGRKNKAAAADLTFSR
jgi:hypothetical protein